MTINHLTPAALQQHALDLAKAWDVRVIISDQLRPEEALGLPHLRVVLTAPITEETTYAVVLHEIGHLASPTGTARLQLGQTGGAVLLEETSAWEWARHYALDWTPSMEAVAAWALNTYEKAVAESREKNHKRMEAALDEAIRQRAEAAAKPVASAPQPTINWNDWK